MGVFQIFSSKCSAVFISHGGRQDAHPPDYINFAQVCWANTVMPKNQISFSMSNGSTWELRFKEYTDLLEILKRFMAYDSKDEGT
ncbi:hypothetical protein [Roseobacter sp.]|uniref:hypothetical protein n=1 Tax=Roseobacter sp. TaxID=1907202 RepID=UPI00385EA5E8